MLIIQGANLLLFVQQNEIPLNYGAFYETRCGSENHNQRSRERSQFAVPSNGSSAAAVIETGATNSNETKKRANALRFSIQTCLSCEPVMTGERGNRPQRGANQRLRLNSSRSKRRIFFLKTVSRSFPASTKAAEICRATLVSEILMTVIWRG